MKALIAFFLSIVGCSWMAAVAEGTNVLAFYLVAEEVPQVSIIYGTAKPEGLRLLPKPIITDRDLLTYDQSSHTFAVSSEAARRVEQACKGRLQTPFVVLAENERIYVGVFSSIYSSISADVPTISVGLWSTNKTVNFTIERGYPGVSVSAPQPDPRSDARIIRAVGRLFPKGKPRN